MKLLKSVMNAVKSHAESSFPEECCGLIVKSEKPRHEYLPGLNISPEPKLNFRLDIQSTLAGRPYDSIEAIVHSHVDETTEFSDADIESCNQIDIPFILYSLPKDHFSVYMPDTQLVPLIGRKFHWGILDCYSLVKDAYELELGIKLSNYPRLGEMGIWMSDDWDQIDKYFEDEGFKELTGNYRLKKYDVILMATSKNPLKPTHMALYWDESKSSMIHHLAHRLSEETVYGGYWSDITVKVVRNVSQG